MNFYSEDATLNNRHQLIRTIGFGNRQPAADARPAPAAAGKQRGGRPRMSGQHSRIRENSWMGPLRDLLLPRQISGEVSVEGL